jgi:hypothetical protein
MRDLPNNIGLPIGEMYPISSRKLRFILHCIDDWENELLFEGFSNSLLLA